MKKQLLKVVALALTAAMLFTGCGLSGSNEPAPAPAPENNQATEEKTEEQAPAPTEVKVGLEQNVYEIPDYTNSDAKVVRLSVSMGAADYGTSASGVMFKTFVDKLEEVSGGAMVAQVFPANQLAGTTDDIVNGLMTGAFEMSEVGQANWGDYTTAFTPMNVPFLYSSDAMAYEVMSGEFGESMFKQFNEDTGLRAAGFMYLGMRCLSNNGKDITSPADLKGLKLRVQNDPTQLKLFEELGASTMTVPFSELFTALQQKLCDGQDNPIITFVSKKFYEVQGNLTLLNHLPNISIFVCSDDWYQSLSDEEKGWVDEAAAAATQGCYDTLVATQDILLQQLKDYGISVTELTDEQYAEFANSVSETWALCKDTLGDEAWDKLMAAVGR